VVAPHGRKVGDLFERGGAPRLKKKGGGDGGRKKARCGSKGNEGSRQKGPALYFYWEGMKRENQGANKAAYSGGKFVPAFFTTIPLPRKEMLPFWFERGAMVKADRFRSLRRKEKLTIAAVGGKPFAFEIKGA